MRSIALFIGIPFLIYLIPFIDTAFSEETITQFEDKNMGIRLSYPSYWDDLEASYEQDLNTRLNLNLDTNTNHSTPFNKHGCIMDVCLASFSIRNTDNLSKQATLEISSFDSEDPAFIRDCKCDSLVEFVQDSYNYTIKTSEEDYNSKIFFINDNQTTIGKNYPAWQVEYSVSGPLYWKHFQIFVKSNNTFYYDINFYSESNDTFSKHLLEIKQLLDSIEFLPIQKSKTPSFMMINKTQ